MQEIEGAQSGNHKQGMVVSAHPLASKAGSRVLKLGGNAVDAAAATALTLGVVSPAFSGIGGGGFMLIFDSKSGKCSVMDYRETAPLRSKRTMFESMPSGDENSIGYRAVAAPSMLLGLSLALEKFGTKSFHEVSLDAARFARDGFLVNRFLSRAMNEDASIRKIKRSIESSKILLRNNDRPLTEGERISFPNLARLLERASEAKSVGEFYLSDFALTVSKLVSSNGGLISQDDFQKCDPKIREPVFERVGDYEVASLPPPSSGGICLIQLLKMMERDLGKDVHHNSAEAIDRIARCLEAVYQDRKTTIADPDFFPVDSKKLVADNYIEKLIEGDYNSRTSVPTQNSHTTHLSVIDGAGNIVSLTESLECYFGAGVFVPEFDLFLNDTMHDFDTDPSSINSVEPLKRPRSSMTPTIVFRDREPFLVLGSAGGPRIISSTFQVVLNVLDFGMGIEKAVQSPRVHYEGSSAGETTLYLEDGSASESAKLDLKGRGYDLKRKHDYFFGGVNAIQISGDKITGAEDPRRN